MKTIIVEDSRLARKELIELLKVHPEVKIVSEAANVKDAYSIITKNEIDLIFLDINLPGKNGFDLLEMLDSVPLVIFTTAYDEYAIKAYEYNALDYLLKPIKPEMLNRAVIKALKIIEKEKTTESLTLKRVFIKDGPKCWLVNVADIIAFESEGNYSRVYFEGNKPLIYKSLNLIEEKVDPLTFFRANRKQIINLNHIRSVKEGISNSLKVTLSNDLIIEISRRSSFRFKSLLSF